ncbi:MAG TPA: hypothetical protein VGX03_20290 [Candidatus Binatia bacterium]|jgi:hypothetical protein|nr:hypothetical protein [Candidatus Binatia bacterium]
MDLRHVRDTRFFVFFSYLLVLSPLVWAADQQSAPPTKHSAKSSRRAANKPVKTEAATPPLVDLSEEAVQTSFDVFTIEWMKKLSDTEEFHRTQTIQVSESPEGFAAEYVGYLPHRYIIVKKTDSKETPFVGILTYYEKTMRCVGKTKEEALKGPFQASDSQQVSEIFRFTKGKWVY